MTSTISLPTFLGSLGPLEGAHSLPVSSHSCIEHNRQQTVGPVSAWLLLPGPFMNDKNSAGPSTVSLRHSRVDMDPVGAFPMLQLLSVVCSSRTTESKSGFGLSHRSSTSFFMSLLWRYLTRMLLRSPGRSSRPETSPQASHGDSCVREMSWVSQLRRDRKPCCRSERMEY